MNYRAKKIVQYVACSVVFVLLFVTVLKSTPSEMKVLYESYQTIEHGMP